jgi:protein phosphatase
VSLRVRAGAATDTGRVRSENQDAYLVLADKGLYVVADGMGGHQGGEVASKLAVDVLRAAYVDTTSDSLTDAISEANEEIYDAGEANANLRGMGTTLVAAALVTDGSPDDPDAESRLLVANVGDSRAYLFRDGDLTQLTEDHSMVADLVREGRISEEEAEVHPQRNIVTRVLGQFGQVDIDLWPVDAVRGDRVLLCSDGLSTEVGADQIAAVLRRLEDPQEAASELVRRANEAGGRDNVTAVVVDVLDDGGVAEAASAALGATGAGAAGEPDLAGFGAARTDDGPTAARSATARRERDDEGAKGPRARRVTWRSVLFVAALLVVIGGAFATIQWYGTHGYFVKTDDSDHVYIYKGQPDGLLWMHPKVVDSLAGLTVTDLQTRYRDQVRDGHELGSLKAARDYVSDVVTTTTTSTTSTTTTTLPAAPPSSVP